jgi:hypothetical protein
MTLTIILAIVFLVGVGIVIYTFVAPRHKAQRLPAEEPRAPLSTTTAWTNEAGGEFAGLSESARCDMIFAVAALDDERSEHLLEYALDDPSEPVALAAAHALASGGRTAVVEAYLAAHPGTRGDRIAHTLSLLNGL